MVVVDKPQGWTSHQVVGRMRRLMGTRKVGHAGTLDPMATGVLIIGVNRATRLLGHLALHDKSYLATIRLGQATTTDDAEGESLSLAEASHLTDAEISAALVRYRGEISQVPSSVSAIKVNGERAYKRVRDGETVELAARPVKVSRYDVLARRDVDRFVDLDVLVDCSSGTYIRALARDLGRDLGVGGHLTALRRTRIGRYSLDSAVDVTVDDAPALMSMADAAALSFAVEHVSEAEAVAVGFGQTIRRELHADPTALLAPAGDLLALYRPDGTVARPVAVFTG